MKKVKLPVSKSLYIRKLISDFQKYRRLDDIGADFPEDVRIVHGCLSEIKRAESVQKSAANPVTIDVRDCGAAYRFLMAVLAVTPGQWLLTGTERLLQRPIDELVQVLRSIGAEIHPCKGGARSVSIDGVFSSCKDEAFPVFTNENGGGWQIHGKPLHASELTIDCTRSGQFATALLLIADDIGLQKLHVLPENPTSAAYIAMTKAVIRGEADLAPQRLGDWSAAVYWYAHLLLSQQNCDEERRKDTSTNAAVSSNIISAPSSYKLLNLDLSSIQSDAVLSRWFADWGIESCQEEDGVVVSYKECHVEPQNVIELDMSQNVDLVPVLACMACLWPKKMVFNGVANLKYKESNRLKVIQEELSAFAEIQLNVYNGINDNQLVVNPIGGDRAHSFSDVGGVFSFGAGSCLVSPNENCLNPTLKFFSFDAHNDHRFVMGFSLFALKGKVQIKGFDCVRKSYPDFKAEGVVAGTDVVG